MAEARSSPLILIADDEKLNRDLLRAFLHNAGYRVIEATNGAEALRLAARLPAAPIQRGAPLVQRPA
jgi:CheY-like chemotaxis protein